MALRKDTLAAWPPLRSRHVQGGRAARERENGPAGLAA